jgi:hypothetical protein
VTAKICKKCCVSNAVDETDDDVLRNGSEEDGNDRRECVRKMKAQTVEVDIETDW